jgi:8-oxo-dGTP pyrophosphatase MutT (NUDIX family)
MAAPRRQETGPAHAQPPDTVAAVRATVLAFEARSPRERASRARLLEELERLPCPFDRDADPVHVTGSAVVVGRRGTVLHLHKRLGRWMQPGGHLDAGEAPWEAALREATEETGLRLRHPDDGPRFIHLDVHPAASGHTHLDLRYLLLGDDADPSPAPGESPHVHWFTMPDAVAMADEALEGALLRVQAEQARRSPDGEAEGR